MKFLERLLGLEAIRAEIQGLRSEVNRLVNLCDSRLRICRCVICNQDFARLPQQSDKRCMACMERIKEARGLGANNRGHRGAGHDTRGIHKLTGPLSEAINK